MLVDAAAAEAADAPPFLSLSRYCWRHVVSDEPYAAVLLPGERGPAITVNRSHVGTPADLAAVARWADDCLGRGELIAFLPLAAIAHRAELLRLR